MKSMLRLSFCLIATISVGTALAQTSTNETNETAAASSSPVAYVYVSRPTHVDGFAASSSGKLTPVPGSPIAGTSVGSMSVTKNYLFGRSGDGKLIQAFSINSKGSLEKAGSILAYKYLPEDCVDFATMQVDASGSTLYAQEDTNCQVTNSAYVSFHIESNGDLQFIGNSGGSIDGINQGFTQYLTVLGDNKFAYDGVCQEDNGNLPDINIYKRESNGLLTYIGQDNQVPSDGAGNPFCTGMVKADSENHLAVALQRIDEQYGDNGFLGGPYFLASYTANANGELTTKSTDTNMPEATFVGDFAPTAMSISPGNKYLALGGNNGFAVYHFNGSDPITKFSNVFLPQVGIGQFGWDKSNHLYVLGGGNLYVYSVTSSGVKEVASYSIPESSSLIVLDLQ